MISFSPAVIEKLNSLSQNYLKGHYIYSNRTEDEYLARRFSAPDKYAHNIKFGISENEKHIRQYYAIRQAAYRQVVEKYISKEEAEKMREHDNFQSGADEYDDHSLKYLAISGDNCVGGIRLTISTPENPNRLTMEHDGFSLQDHFPDIDLGKVTYCEASKLAVLPDFRNGDLWNQLHERSTKFLLDEIGMEIGFCQSHSLQTRRVKAQFANIGYDMVVRKDIQTSATKQFKDLNMQLWAMDFTGDRKYHDSLKAPEKAEITEKEAVQDEFA